MRLTSIHSICYFSSSLHGVWIPLPAQVCMEVLLWSSWWISPRHCQVCLMFRVIKMWAQTVGSSTRCTLHLGPWHPHEKSRWSSELLALFWHGSGRYYCRYSGKWTKWHEISIFLFFKKSFEKIQLKSRFSRAESVPRRKSMLLSFSTILSSAASTSVVVLFCLWVFLSFWGRNTLEKMVKKKSSVKTSI